MNAFPGVGSPRGFSFTGDELIDSYNVDADHLNKTMQGASPTIEVPEAQKVFE